MRFRAEIRLSGKTATGLPVPTEVVESLGRGKWPPVRVTINGHTYCSTVATVGGDYRSSSCERAARTDRPEVRGRT
jgi:hypothetical protein